MRKGLTSTYGLCQSGTKSKVTYWTFSKLMPCLPGTLELGSWSEESPQRTEPNADRLEQTFSRTPFRHKKSPFSKTNKLYHPAVLMAV